MAGAFRGVPFEVEASRVRGGRNVALHEFPGTEEFVALDMGVKAKAFNVRCFVAGGDYLEKRDRLIAALERGGVGTLQHPFYGVREVLVTRFQVSESSRDQGAAQLDIVFTLAAPLEPGAGKPILQLRGEAEDASKVLLEVGVTDLEEAVVVDGVPEFVREAAVQELGTVVEDLDAAIRGGSIEAVSGFVRKATAIVDRGLELLGRPRALGRDIQLLISEVEGVIGGRRETLRILLEQARRTRPVSLGSSYMQVRADGNRQAISDLVVTTALARACTVAAHIRWESREEAERALESIQGVLDDHEITAGDRAYQAIQELRAAAAAVLPPPNTDLPRIATVALEETMPAVLVSHRLYGSIEKADDIIARNGVRHPGFVPGGKQLEVLASA